MSVLLTFPLLDSSRKSCYVSYAGAVYDITPFFPDHPGGDDILMEWAGKDVGKVMGDEDQHVHSRSAYDMMEEYKVGELGGDERIVSEGVFESGLCRFYC